MKPAHLGPELTNQPRCHKRSSTTGPAAWLYKNLQEPHSECVFERSSGGIDTCEHSQRLTPGGFWNSRRMVYLWHSCRLWYRSAWVYFFGLAQPILVRAQSRPLNFRKIKPPGRPADSRWGPARPNLSSAYLKYYSLQGVILQETVEMPKTETNSSEKFKHNLHTYKVQVLEHSESHVT